MNLRLVILENPRTCELNVVHPIYPVAHGFELNEKDRLWKNAYYQRGEQWNRIGSWDYWSGYEKGTVVAVIDQREIEHLKLLANLRSKIEAKQARDHSPSRDT